MIFHHNWALYQGIRKTEESIFQFRENWEPEHTGYDVSAEKVLLLETLLRFQESHKNMTEN